MVRPRRRLVIGIVLCVLLVAAVPLVRTGWKWKQAFDNVTAMQVEQLTLPTLTPAAPSEDTDNTSIDTESPVAMKPTDVPPTKPTAIPTLDESVNILLLGTDGRVGDETSRTDAIILVRLDAETNRVSLLSFPRDLWVDIPSYGENKINAVYPIGEKQFGKGYGPALMKETIGQLTGFQIDHFVMINFDGFKTLIDKMGGITIDVPKEILDTAYPVDEYVGDTRTMTVHFLPGPQLMDGETALIYARTRHADSDFGRNQRQQQVLMAIFDKARQDGIMNNLNNVDVYTAALRDYVRTDMSRNTMFKLASIAPGLNANSIQQFSISAKMVSEASNPYRLILSDTKGFERILDEMQGNSIAAAGNSEP
jgi:LCP family protein required for cell wall assembly